MQALKRDLEGSPCECGENQAIVFEVFRQVEAIEKVKEIFKDSRCKIQTAYTFYEHKGKEPFDQLKAEIEIYSNTAQIIDAHYIFWEKHPQLLEVVSNLNFVLQLMVIKLTSLN